MAQANQTIILSLKCGIRYEINSIILWRKPPIFWIWIEQID